MFKLHLHPLTYLTHHNLRLPITLLVHLARLPIKPRAVHSLIHVHFPLNTKSGSVTLSTAFSTCDLLSTQDSRP